MKEVPVPDDNQRLLKAFETIAGFLEEEKVGKSRALALLFREEFRLRCQIKNTLEMK